MRALRLFGILLAAAAAALVAILLFGRNLSVDSRFGPGVIVIDSTMRLEVNAYGSWREGDWNGRRAAISGAPYLVAVRIFGAGDSAQVTMLQIADSVSGEVVEIREWAMRSYSLVDSTVGLATDQTITLTPGGKYLSGAVQFRTRSGEMVSRRFDGRLPHAVSEERKRLITYWLRA